MMSARLPQRLAYLYKAAQRCRNVSRVLSFHAITSKIQETCVPALTYSFSTCIIEKLGMAGGRRQYKCV